VLVGLDPVVDALRGDLEHAGDIGRGAAAVILQDGQEAAIESDIAGLQQLTLKATPLPGSNLQPAHSMSP
jgi:hypothetical protein